MNNYAQLFYAEAITCPSINLKSDVANLFCCNGPPIVNVNIYCK